MEASNHININDINDTAETQTRLRARAHKQVDRQVTPGYLKDTFDDLAYWHTKLALWQQKEVECTDKSAPWYPTITRKITEISEILATFERDARQLNRKLR